MDNNNTNKQDNQDSSLSENEESKSALPGDLGTPGKLEELEKKHGEGARQGNSSIQLDNEETIGVP